jgi:hypothetical protein
MDFSISNVLRNRDMFNPKVESVCIGGKVMICEIEKAIRTIGNRIQAFIVNNKLPFLPRD